MKISLRRPVTSYARVARLLGGLIRNRRFQLNRERIKNLRYLDLGCGTNTHEHFINLDFLWSSSVDICWDVTHSVPFASASMQGIFTEHFLEHFSLSVGFAMLKECRRILMPGGVLRIVMPDGELYLNAYQRQTSGDPTARFPFQDQESFGGIYSPILSVNRVFYQDRHSPYGHCCIYDFNLLDRLLRHAGFEAVVKTGFRSGTDPKLLIDTQSRQCESFYVEAIVGTKAP